MNPAPLSIPEFEMHREELHRAFSKADTALAAGTITQVQRDVFLKHLYGSASERDALSLLRSRLITAHPAEPDRVENPEQDENSDYTAPLQVAPARTDQSRATRVHARDEEREHDPRLLIGGFVLLVAILFSTAFWFGGGITGAAITETVYGINRTFTQDNTLQVILDNTDAVTLTGTASGQGDVIVTLELNGTIRTIVTYRHAPPATAHGALTKSQYTTDEPVTLTATGITLAALESPDGTRREIATDFAEPLPEGAYAIELSGDEAGVPFTERLAFTVVAPGTPEPHELIQTCGDACALERSSGEGTLRVAIVGDATLTITDLLLTKLSNTPPVFVATIPDQSGESVTLDLSAYFTDADGDTLLYETSHPPGATETLDGSIVTIAGQPGTYTYLAYASDLSDLVESNPFTVTILSAAINETNATPELNATNGTVAQPPTDLNLTNATNLTEPVVDPNTTNGTTVPLPGVLDLNGTNLTNATAGPGCDEADPNLRPEYCLNQEGATYFEEDVFLETPDREARARVTAIGNLLITGRVLPHSTAVPGDRDYTIGYKDADFQYVPTIWIDPDGNLHLHGTIHEENANLVPPSGSYAMINRRGVYMLWADQYTGDLYIRGNVIPYRVSIYG